MLPAPCSLLPARPLTSDLRLPTFVLFPLPLPFSLCSLPPAPCSLLPAPCFPTSALCPLTSGSRPRKVLAPASREGSGYRLRSEEHTSELQSRPHLVCRLLLEKKKKK